MKRRLMTLILGGMLTASMLAGCGGSKEAAKTSSSTAVESEADDAASESVAEEDEEEADSEDTADEADSEETAEESTSTGEERTASGVSWTFGDIDASMIKAAVVSDPTDEGVETVATFINAPDGETYAAMGQVLSADGVKPDNADIYLVHVTSDNMKTTESDGLQWTTVQGPDLYTGEDIKIGFAESADSGEASEDQCAVFDESGQVLNAHYLTADQAVQYLGVCAGLQASLSE